MQKRKTSRESSASTKNDAKYPWDKKVTGRAARRLIDRHTKALMEELGYSRERAEKQAREFLHLLNKNAGKMKFVRRTTICLPSEDERDKPL